MRRDYDYGINRKQLHSSAKSRTGTGTNCAAIPPPLHNHQPSFPDLFSNLLLAPLSPSCSLRIFVPLFLDVSVSPSREIRVAQRFSVPTIIPFLHLHSGIRFRDRVTKENASCGCSGDSDGYNTLVFPDQLQSIVWGVRGTAVC